MKRSVGHANGLRSGGVRVGGAGMNVLLETWGEHERKWKRYPAYRDSGVEWLGAVPEGWDVKRLKYCAARINEKVDGRESDLPYTGLEHIESWTGRLTPSEEISTSEGQSSRYEPGDVLFGKLRPYLAKAFRAKEHGICTGELLVLRPKDVLQDYLFSYVLARDFISIVDSSTYGAKMPRASWDFIGDLPVLLPSEAEQRTIAAFLDRETGRIDALTTKVHESISKLREYRTALISAAVTGKIDVREELVS
ncbi:MAG: restriction endonuclease subunit S [Bacteroidetes bacterium]|nr:restriction endonuclease subunit S [Bacteroidota bacterium]